MEHAIVIGGSMAGLLASRVLRDHYAKVTVVERDSFPLEDVCRRGVPQARHAHALLASGRRVLELLFPGISGEVIQCGALPANISRDTRWYLEGGRHIRTTSDIESLAVSRPFLENTVRRRLLALPNVYSRENFVVEGLVTDVQDRVTGIRSAGETISADLVVDATGRASHSPQWLEALGFTKPHEERVEVAVSYTTRFFRRHPSDLDGDLAAVIPPTPQGKRGGVIVAQEGDRWIVTLLTHFAGGAPADLPGFIEFASSLPASCLYEVIRYAEPLGEAATTRFPASTRRYYEKLGRFPEGYLVFGDAISSFNPIYAQGMSVAALEAVQLMETLAEGSSNLARRFFKRAGKVVDMPWSIAVGNDFRMPEVKGRRGASLNFVNWYVSRLHRAAHHDPAASLAFHRVANLLAPPKSILSPGVAMRVMRSSLRTSAKVRENKLARAALGE
jgi:2-polyprenyl-6-methoxyphenol hydroxylase-like FAD-dependent oxidoreductase